MNYDIIIIGSGVAGLTSAIYASRANKSVLVIEDGVLGGTTATLDVIENYPGIIKISGFELIQNMYAQAVSFGTNFEFVSINSIDFDNNQINTDNSIYKYSALIIASGSSYIRVNAENEDKYKLKGLSYCAVCDGALFRGKNIAVITNGNSAKASIDYLNDLVSNISVLDISNKYNDQKHSVYHNVVINKFLGDDRLESIEFISDESATQLDVDGVFVSLGKTTDLNLYSALNNDGKYLITDENMHSNIDNVFVAGDIRKKSLRQIVTACSDGAIAATEAIKFITKK